jgi:hypothetical protein
MKLLTVLLLTCVLSLGVACSSEPAPAVTPEPTATPAPKYSEGEVIGLVHGILRSHPDEDCSNLLNGSYKFSATYSKERWFVYAQYGEVYRGSWLVYEGSNAIKQNSPCLG